MSSAIVYKNPETFSLTELYDNEEQNVEKLET
jgi:hypothetical protein